MSMLKKHRAALSFTTAEAAMLDQSEDSSEALADPEGLAWQVSTKLHCCAALPPFIPVKINKIFKSAYK